MCQKEADLNPRKLYRPTVVGPRKPGPQASLSIPLSGGCTVTLLNPKFPEHPLSALCDKMAFQSPFQVVRESEVLLVKDLDAMGAGRRG